MENTAGNLKEQSFLEGFIQQLQNSNDYLTNQRSRLFSACNRLQCLPPEPGNKADSKDERVPNDIVERLNFELSRFNRTNEEIDQQLNRLERVV